MRMQVMRRVVLLFLIIAILLTGCTNPQRPSQDTSDEPNSSAGVPSVSEPTNPDEDLPTANGAVNPDDYWVSDTEFDIIGYCEANGLEKHKIIEPEMGNTIISLYHNDWQGDKIVKITKIELGDGYFVVATREDFANLEATQFNANTDFEQQDDKVTFSGTDVVINRNRMDFIIYVIPRLLDESIDDPMQGFGFTHRIFRAEVQATANGRSIIYEDEGEIVYD